tara:strand:+ start:2369 stop:2812 length:444 start_codon:yes stop_codon:yes gene_type:complete
MIAEYIFYHGALLHELTLNHGGAVTIEPRDNHGRPNTFILNSKVGVYIKHSTKRLSPWTYTFTKEHLSEVQALCEYVSTVYTCFICGDDGIGCVPIEGIISILGPAESDQAWIRFERRSNKMYRVSGANGELPNKLARGVDAITNSL